MICGAEKHNFRILLESGWMNEWNREESLQVVERKSIFLFELLAKSGIEDWKGFWFPTNRGSESRFNKGWKMFSLLLSLEIMICQMFSIRLQSFLQGFSRQLRLLICLTWIYIFFEVILKQQFGRRLLLSEIFSGRSYAFDIDLFGEWVINLRPKTSKRLHSPKKKLNNNDLLFMIAVCDTREWDSRVQGRGMRDNVVLLNRHKLSLIFFNKTLKGCFAIRTLKLLSSLIIVIWLCVDERNYPPSKSFCFEARRPLTKAKATKLTLKGSAVGCFRCCIPCVSTTHSRTSRHSFEFPDSDSRSHNGCRRLDSELSQS